VIEQLDEVLDNYVRRGVLRGYRQCRLRRHRVRFEIVWFRARRMQVDCDLAGSSLRLREFLPVVRPRSLLDRQLRGWLREQQQDGLPPHRRVDPERIGLTLRNLQGSLALHVKCRDGDLVHGLQRLIHLVNALYLDFLVDGSRHDWLIEAFDLDPDNLVWP